MMADRKAASFDLTVSLDLKGKIASSFPWILNKIAIVFDSKISYIEYASKANVI